MNYQEFAVKFLISNLLPAVVMLVLGSIAIKLILKVLKKVLGKFSNRIDPMVFKFISNAIRILLWVVLMLEVFKLVGIDTTSVLTVFAAAGAAVALALKDSLSNLASGIIIMVTKPFVFGDYIESGSIAGTVDSIDLLTTTIITPDNKVISVPNSTLTGNAITNFTRMETRRVDITIGVAYDADLDAAKRAILSLAKSDERFLSEPAPTCNVSEYSDSAVILLFRAWVKTSNYWDVYFAAQNGMKRVLDEAGIEIPYPQIDVHQK